MKAQVVDMVESPASLKRQGGGGGSGLARALKGDDVGSSVEAVLSVSW